MNKGKLTATPSRVSTESWQRMKAAHSGGMQYAVGILAHGQFTPVAYCIEMHDAGFVEGSLRKQVEASDSKDKPADAAVKSMLIAPTLTLNAGVDQTPHNAQVAADIMADIAKESKH